MRKKPESEGQNGFQRMHCAWHDERKIAKCITAFIPRRCVLRMAVIDRVGLILVKRRFTAGCYTSSGKSRHPALVQLLHSRNVKCQISHG